jgi:hypothetical protein
MLSVGGVSLLENKGIAPSRWRETSAGDVGANLRLDSHVPPSSTPTRKEAKTRRREAVAIGRACTITWLFFDELFDPSESGSPPRRFP